MKKNPSKTHLVQDCSVKLLRKEVMELGYKLEFGFCVRAVKEFPT